MLNNRLKEEAKKHSNEWGFDFLSGLTGKSPHEFYRIQIEKKETTCETCMNMANKMFLIREAVMGKNFPPFHPHCNCTAVDKENNKVVLWIQQFIDSMAQSYGFTEAESKLILRAYQLLINEANRIGMTKQQKIHHVFSILAALCDSYSGVAFRWWAVGEIPPTEQSKNHLSELGMDISEIDVLYKSINKQHLSTQNINKDFAHELIQYAIFSADLWTHNFLEMLLGNLNALGSYKGDVFSARMDIDDMNSDLDANNIYNRMLSDNKGFLEIIVEYNIYVNNGTINRFDEFLKFYGNGDIKKGLEYIKDDLLNVDRGSHYISETYDGGKLGFILESLIDNELNRSYYTSKYMLKNDNLSGFFEKSTNANKTFAEDESFVNSEENTTNKKTIIDIMNNFIKYLEEGMSK